MSTPRPNRFRKVHCRQYNSYMCGHLHSRRCPVIDKGTDLEKCNCAWREAAIAAGIVKGPK